MIKIWAILFLILKIIGILLLVLLCLILLLLGLLLFVPIRYEALGKGEKSLESLRAKLTVSWLFRLLQIDVIFKEKTLKWRVRIAFKKMMGGQKYGANAGDGEKGARGDSDDYESDLLALLDDEENLLSESDTLSPSQSDLHLDVDTVSEQSDSGILGQSEPAETRADGQTDANGQGKGQGKLAKEPEQTAGRSEKEPEKSSARPEKADLEEGFERAIEKIKCTFRTFCDKIKALSDKKDRILLMLTDEVHLKALLKLKKVGLRLLKKWKPKQLRIDGSIGYEDPQIAGSILAAYSVLHPYLGRKVRLDVDFQETKLCGVAELSGKLRLWPLLIALLRLLLYKPVRQTFQDIKNFEL